MTDDEPPVPVEPPAGPSRRTVLKWTALGGAAAAAVGGGVWLATRDDPAPRRSAGASAKRQRVLVVVELGGGNDGLSTLVPYEDGRYHDLRPTLALDGDEVIDIGGGLGVNRRLRGVHDRGLTLLAGVGTAEPVLSHFEMLDRWAVGDPRPASSAARAKPTAPGGFGTGFLGRLCDAVGEPGALTGVSLHFGDNAPIRAAATSTVGLGDVTNNAFTDAKVAAEARDLMRAMARGRAPAHLDAARSSLTSMVDVLDAVRALPAVTATYPETDLGRQLALASRFVLGETAIRVIHVPMGVSRFDTHRTHLRKHADLMDELNDALVVFVDDLIANGVADDVLIATTSEFGRRPEEHGDGLDHGTASTMLLLGPTVAGLHGEPSSLQQLDPLDNLVASLGFDRYFATLASWLDVDPAAVLPKVDGSRAPEPVAGILRV